MISNCTRIFILPVLFTLFFSVCLFAQAEQPVTSTQILQTTTTWNKQQLKYPQNGSEQITALEIEFSPGAKTTWHKHPVPSLAYIISGELEVIIKDSGVSKIFKQ